MGTLDKLARIEESDFETLIALYLRRRDPKLKGLIQTGINAEGKSIKCPVDGIVYVPGVRPLIVNVAVTVYELPGLRRKWLGGPQGKKFEPGDIKKAEEEFAKWQHENVREAVRKLYLATNRPLENNTRLYLDAVERCTAAGIEVEVIEASQLVDFLDHDPEGQYLRQEYLGIEAGRLSESLLSQIALQSLELHQEKFGVSFSKQGIEITREAEQRLADAVEHLRAPLIGIRGASGAGKSTLARQYGVRINERGGICIWAPAEEITRNVTPAALLLRILKHFHSGLNERAGDDALDIADKIPGGIVLLTDDVNRESAPREALEAARLYVRADSRTRGDQAVPRVSFVVPLWPEQLASRSAGDSADWKFIELGFYTAQEKEELVAAHRGIDSTELASLIDALNGDPFFCGLALRGHPRATLVGATTRAVLAKGIIEDELGKAAGEAASSRRVPASPEEFVEALDELVGLMLRKEQPDPMWSEARAELNARTVELLVVLGETNRLGWIEPRSEGSRWRWKHDRLRDALAGRWLAKKIAPRLASGEASNEDQKLLQVPGTAEAWAWSLAFATLDERVRLVEALAEHNPLALAEALTLVGFPDGDAARSSVIEGLRRGLEGFELSGDTFVVSPQWPLLRRLSETDDPVILEVTESMNRNWHVWLARFRNGDTRAALRLMRQEGAWDEFLPATQFSTLERAVEAYARARGNNRVEVADELEHASDSPKDVVGVMTLCGYLAWHELAHTAWKAWESFDEEGRQATLVPLIWALSRCADESMQDKLEVALLRARGWSDEDNVEGNTHHGSDRHWSFVEPLRFALRREMTPESSETWAKVATEQEDMRETFLQLLREMDHPAIVEAYVRLTSKFGGSWFDQIEGARHPGDNDGLKLHERVPVTAASRERLWQIVEGDGTERLRQVAFWLWKRFPVESDIEKLHNIEESNPLFNQALQVRLRLHDRTATPLLIERINADPGTWCPYVYTLYHEEGVAEALFSNLESGLQSDPIEKQYVVRVPRSLPPDGIRRLVSEKRELLLRTPRMWNSLWRSDSSEAMEFLTEAIPQASAEDLRCAFRLSNGNSYPVSQRMLDAIEPVLRFLPEREQSYLASLVVNAGRADWAESQGLKRVTRGFKNGKLRNWINEEDALVSLNAAARAVPQGVRRVKRTVNFYHIKSQSNKIAFNTRKLLRRWLGAAPSPESLIVGAMLIASFGTGEDVEWWAELEPDEGGGSYEPWLNALYILRRLRWQKHDKLE